MEHEWLHAGKSFSFEFKNSSMLFEVHAGNIQTNLTFSPGKDKKWLQ